MQLYYVTLSCLPVVQNSFRPCGIACPCWFPLSYLFLNSKKFHLKSRPGRVALGNHISRTASKRWFLKQKGRWGSCLRDCSVNHFPGRIPHTMVAKCLPSFAAVPSLRRPACKRGEELDSRRTQTRYWIRHCTVRGRIPVLLDRLKDDYYDFLLLLLSSSSPLAFAPCHPSQIGFPVV
jgi:hypothetical protein